MREVQVTTYGPGGYDPAAPNGNVIETRTERIEDENTAPTLADVLDALEIKGTLSRAEIIAAKAETAIVKPVRG